MEADQLQLGSEAHAGMPQDLKEICEPEMLFPQAEEKLSCSVGSVFVSGVGVVSV